MNHAETRYITTMQYTDQRISPPEERETLESGGTVTYTDDGGEVCEIWLDFGDDEED